MSFYGNPFDSTSFRCKQMCDNNAKILFKCKKNKLNGKIKIKYSTGDDKWKVEMWKCGNVEMWCSQSGIVSSKF